MKKLLSDPNDYADQAIDGLCLAYPDIYTRGGENGRVVYRTGGARQGKVGIVSGGGSGHLPVFTGYCGDGLIDACAIGNVFAGPSPSLPVRRGKARLPCGCETHATVFVSVGSNRGGAWR